MHKALAALLISLGLLIAGCGGSTPASSTVTVLRADDVLTFQPDGTLQLKGPTVGSQGHGDGPGEPVKLRTAELAVRAMVDGVAADIVLPLQVDDDTVIIGESGSPVPRLEQGGFDDNDVRFWLATVRRQGKRELLALDIRPWAGASASPDSGSAPAGSPVSELTADGVLDFQADGTLQLTGSIGGSESSPTAGGLSELYFDVPATIDGVAAYIEFVLTVNDDSVMLDRSGHEIPRLKQDDYTDAGTRYWLATVRRLDTKNPLVVEMRPWLGH